MNFAAQQRKGAIMEGFDRLELDPAYFRVVEDKQGGRSLLRVYVDLAKNGDISVAAFMDGDRLVGLISAKELHVEPPLGERWKSIEKLETVAARMQALEGRVAQLERMLDANRLESKP
jgi:hypothetical protein